MLRQETRHQLMDVALFSLPDAARFFWLKNLMIVNERLNIQHE